MTDEIGAKSEDLGKRIEEFKKDLDMPTPQGMYDARAAKHAAENGTGLNSGKA